MSILDKFTKKKKKTKKNAEDDVDVKSSDKSADESSESNPVKKDKFFLKFKKKIRIVIKRKNAKGGKADKDEDDGEGKEGKVKQKKAKKPKVKKEKKPKAKKTDDEAEGGKKIKPLILILIIGGGILVGVAAFFIITFVLNRPTVEEQLLTARLMISEQKYDEASKIYQKLLKKDSALADAYIGVADITVANGDTDAAVQGLTEALVPTSDDPVIQAKIDELTKPEVPDDAVSATSGVISGPIVFKDASLEKMLRLALKKPSGDITEADLKDITAIKILGNTHSAVNVTLNSFNKNSGYVIDGVLYTERGTIKSLGDLTHLKNLRKLIIAYNAIEDIKGIENLTNLETVGLYFNDIKNVEPLSKLTGLKYLYIYDNQITDISPLASLTGLEQLWLSKNKITNISAVSSMSDLEELFVNDNEISDVSPVSKLKKLQFLYAERNKISDLASLKNMTSLSDVSFVDNPVSDYSPVAHVFNVNKPFSSAVK